MYLQVGEYERAMQVGLEAGAFFLGHKMRRVSSWKF